MKIKSYWQSETGRWDNNSNSFINKKLSELKEKELEVIITKSPTQPKRKILKFIGGPTGHESYYLEDLNFDIENKSEKFYICAGTINSWFSCYVMWNDLKKIII